MKRLILLAIWVVGTHFATAQTAPYNVVFDLTSADTADHQSMILMMNLISSTRPDAKMEVVLYGQSLGMIVKDRSTVAGALKQLSSNKNISIKVCEAAMKRHNIERSQLLEGIETVPDGIFEIITKQKEGWGYIKVAR